MALLNTVIPEIWPTPNNSATRLRCFRIEIERPLNSIPSVAFHMNEAIEVSSTNFERHRPEYTPIVSFADLLMDPELSETANRIASDLGQLTYALYLRKKAAIELPPDTAPVI
jgi:aspartyl aminopeptidase